MRVRTSLITLAGLVLVLSACTSSASSEVPCFRGPREWGPAMEGPRVEAPASEGLAAMKVRYYLARRGDPVRQVRSDSIQEQADAAGVEIAFCDSEIDAAKASPARRTSRSSRSRPS